MELRIKVVTTEKMAGKKFYNLYEVKITGFDEHTLLHGKIGMFGLIPWEIIRECIG